ncbi:MAG: hypothetical protein JOS17DRAFT_771037 [Linnemannia elongata]|nr:MAG: hypothetical protein JOS17DRAFT_771037 [Linnemannia elongata]
MTERLTWEDSISRLLRKALSHTTTYTVPNISNFKVSIHPNVYSPKYFPESKWYGQQLEKLVQPGQDFLESPWQSPSQSVSMASAAAAAAGATLSDSDSETEKNRDNDWEEPLQEADIRVSDLYSALPRDSKFHYIFWNHPWQNSTSIVKELKTEKTLDEGYCSLSRYMAQGRAFLHEDGEILIGTSCYADLSALNVLAEENGFRTEVAREGRSLLEDGTTEEVYYILRLVDLQKTQAQN